MIYADDGILLSDSREGIIEQGSEVLAEELETGLKLRADKLS